MPTNTQQQTATILRFPVGGRAARDAAGKASALGISGAAKRVSYDAWYHQEAIDEDAAPTKQ